MPFLPPNARHRRIIQLSQEWGIDLPPAPAPLKRPQNPPTFWTPKDDQTAETLMQRRAAELSQSRPKSGLSRAFSANNLKKGKNWDPREVLEVLTSWVASGGSPGVAEALIFKLAAGGVDLGGNQTKQKHGLLNRRRSIDTFVDRSKLLKLAVEGSQLDMLQILLPHADSFSIDQALAPAIRKGNVQIVELLLRYGAAASQTPEGQDTFRRACVLPDRSRMIGLLLQSETGQPSAWTSACMCDAAKAACLETIIHLSRATADGNYNGAEALKAAVTLGRTDITLVIIMGNHPPQTPGLNEAFQILHEHSSMDPPTKLAMAELLLCAGANGPVISQALESACEAQFDDMANLLAKYGASVEHNDATALKTAIARSDIDLVSSLLASTTKLSPSLASSCVSSISRQTPSKSRVAMLSLLLEKGAKGVALDDMLIEAVEAKDDETIDLLLNPIFPEPSSSVLNASNRPNLPAKVTRHEVASVNRKSGQALRIAVLRADAATTEKLLASQPSADTLSFVMPSTKNLSAKDRHQIVRLFLGKSLSGPPLHAALQDAIEVTAPQRDEELIQMLLNHGADVNFGQGSGLETVIKQSDITLLRLLLPKISPRTAAARVQDVMSVSDHRKRFEIMTMLINAGAAAGTEEIAAVLLQTLSETPVDMSMLRLLLQQARADINLLDGAIGKQAVSNPDPKVLDMVFGLAEPSTTTATCALTELASMPSTDSKAWKLRVILSKSHKKESLDKVLVQEVQSLLSSSVDKTTYSTLKILLDEGADPNTFKAAALCHAVKGANPTILDLILGSKTAPTLTSLGVALPYVLHVTDPSARLVITKRLVDAGTPPLEINNALVYAISTCPNDISLQRVLATTADVSDGQALALSVSKESPETMDILLAQSKSTTKTRSIILGKAMEVKNRTPRNQMCKQLLQYGTTVEAASTALLVAAREGDVELGDLLIAHGATMTTNNGQAVIEACRGGSADVLRILLKQEEAAISTLKAGFQAATEVRDLGKRAVIFEQLLNKGVKGDLVDAQLQSAARCGEDGEAVLRVLLTAGADPNFNHGECVLAATRSAFIGNLELLLGLWNDGSHQKKPSQPTLARALKACWNLSRDSRFKIITDLIAAGLQVTNDSHGALNEAINEDEPEERLVRTLLAHGASPAANGCKTLVDAVNNSASSCLKLLLESDLPIEDLGRAFNNAYTAEKFEKWFSQPGLEAATLLLDRGACGDSLGRALALCIKHATEDTKVLADGFVTLLISHGADVNYNNGEPLQLAASKADLSWTTQLLECRPTAESLTSAFQCIFDTSISQDGVLELFKLFAEHRDGSARIDVMSSEQGPVPVLVKAISRYPRSTDIVETLLDAGLYYDQATNFKIHDDISDEEQMTVLLWALAQPQKRVSSAVIELLITRGANVNSETSLSRTTALMLAIQTKRADLVKVLLLQGADEDRLDYLGRSPLSMATQVGGDTSIQMTTLLLAADPSRDDGSLHSAARDLNLPVVKVLVQAGHDPDFPSPLHEGRSALAELCLHSSDNGEMTTNRERTMQKVMTFLIDAKSDLSITANSKSLLHLCFEASDPITTTKCLLKSGMWKHINKSFNNHTTGGFTYSPTMYIKKLLPPSDQTSELLNLLQANRANDTYYANSGPQPDGCIGLPDDMAVQERARKARLDRLTEESEDFSVAMARKREIASVEQQIITQKMELEDMRRRKLHNEDVAAIRSKAQVEESLAGAAHARRIQEQTALADSSISRARALAAAELDAEEARRRKTFDHESKLNMERVDNARALSAIRISERQEVERLEKGAEQRIKSRLDAQRKLVESQEKLAKRLADGSSNVAAAMSDPRRQIGYVTELN